METGGEVGRRHSEENRDNVSNFTSLFGIRPQALGLKTGVVPSQQILKTDRETAMLRASSLSYINKTLQLD
jgi:hypothetical protein